MSPISARAVRPAHPSPRITARDLTLAAHTQARNEARAVAEGVDETVALDEARGAVFARPKMIRGERAKPVIRLDGLAWLASKGRLTPKQVHAGQRYGKLVEIMEAGQIGSCMALPEVRTSGRKLSPTDAKAWARVKLTEARAAVGEHPGLVFALDQICGLGRRPREVTTDQRASERLEDRLGVGLDLLIRAWGL